MRARRRVEQEQPEEVQETPEEVREQPEDLRVHMGYLVLVHDLPTEAFLTCHFSGRSPERYPLGCI
jgi:hypothetical protein